MSEARQLALSRYVGDSVENSEHNGGRSPGDVERGQQQDEELERQDSNRTKALNAGLNGDHHTATGAPQEARAGCFDLLRVTLSGACATPSTPP